MKSFYITTTLPYVNADPHLGHALEFVRADVIARWKELGGFEVFFNTGVDEHGQKILRAAEAVDQDPQEYVDHYASRFKSLLDKLNVKEDIHFIRTTDEHHVMAAQEFWKRVDKNGYIYKKSYSAKYCVGCESEKTDSELEDGKCPLHPNLDIELIEEENYFFKFSEFKDKLMKFYEENPDLVVPRSRLADAKNFVSEAKDFSISRLKEKMPWGVPVPGDEDHVMYVWFDALVNYISTLGWPEDEESFNKFWTEGTPTQYCGKDNTRFQAGIWQAMLMAAGLPHTHQVVVNGFVTADGGVKMSKSLGNVVDPVEVVEEYGRDAFRYFVCRELSTFEDSPFTKERFKESYNANLANGLGNLVARTMKLAEQYLESGKEFEGSLHTELEEALDNFEIQTAMNHIWREIGELDAFIQETEPFKVIKTDKEKGIGLIEEMVEKLLHIGISLQPFMPETSDKIVRAVTENKMPETLFPRKD